MKNLVVTTKGRRFKKDIPDKLWNGSNTFSSLTADERSQLTDLLTKLVANHR